MALVNLQDHINLPKNLSNNLLTKFNYEKNNISFNNQFHEYHVNKCPTNKRYHWR